jgi:hypothetical protein
MQQEIETAVLVHVFEMAGPVLFDAGALRRSFGIAETNRRYPNRCRIKSRRGDDCHCQDASAIEIDDVGVVARRDVKHDRLKHVDGRGRQVVRAVRISRRRRRRQALGQQASGRTMGAVFSFVRFICRFGDTRPSTLIR